MHGGEVRYYTAEMFWEDSGTGTRGFRNQEFGIFQVVATAEVRAHVPSKR